MTNSTVALNVWTSSGSLTTGQLIVSYCKLTLTRSRLSLSSAHLPETAGQRQPKSPWDSCIVHRSFPSAHTPQFAIPSLGQSSRPGVVQSCEFHRACCTCRKTMVRLSYLQSIPWSNQC
jgi:hypothetical protein